jgi:Asp-tRNA(Asn)/Glu-tRNA(Gln) amidotransferase A subunit family amidase
MTAKSSISDATALIEQIQDGSTAIDTIITQFLERIQQLHPKLNAATTIFSDRDKLIAEAREQAAQGRPLMGLPISVKETFGLAGTSITAGSRRMPSVPVEEDCVLIDRVRKAGAVVLARSNVPEFAMTGETSNTVYGRTNSCLGEAWSSGGSSGGEGALVGSGCSAFGLGSDILGSIRLPAAFNGIVGFKPHSSAINKKGTWPEVSGFTNSFLCLGPLTRSVRDSRLVYNQIADVPLSDSFAAPEGLRLFTSPDFPLSFRQKCVEEAYRYSARELVSTAGMQPASVSLKQVGKWFLYLQQIITHDFEQSMLDNLVTSDGEEFSKLVELWNQITGNPQVDGGLFRMLLLMPIIRPRSPGRVEKIQQEYLQGREELYDTLGEDGILLLPTLGTTTLPHGALNANSLKPGVNKMVTSMTFPNYMNLSAISVPAWRFTDSKTGLPPGIMLCCRSGSEEHLLNAARALESIIT